MLAFVPPSSGFLGKPNPKLPNLTLVPSKLDCDLGFTSVDDREFIPYMHIGDGESFFFWCVCVTLGKRFPMTQVVLLANLDRMNQNGMGKRSDQADGRFIE